jgi:hypothetical protein
MALTAKIWEPAFEEKPVDLFNKKRVPDAPPSWFKENPAKAAELYALELGHPNPHGDPIKRRIHVEDSDGALHVFDVVVYWAINARVRKMLAAADTDASGG